MTHISMQHIPHFDVIAISVSVRRHFTTNEGPLLIYINFIPLVKQLYSCGHARQAASNNRNLKLWSILHLDECDCDVRGMLCMQGK